MLSTRFGVEIEFTGITRKKAAEAVCKVVGGTVEYVGTCYETFEVHAGDGRTWKVMRDASIRCERKDGDATVSSTASRSCELVTPILRYEDDIDTLQEVVRALRKAGGFTNPSCGIHIHLDGNGHDARSIRNFINIIYSHNDLFYKALGIENERMRFCKELDGRLVRKVNERKPRTLAEMEDLWYEGYWGGRTQHYHNSRYHFLNLHSFFHGHHTVELRGFNSTLHAGEVRSYIVFALALNHQALTQKSASTRKPQVENEKFAMRTYLNRIGLIGDEFKACRNHLTKHLSGSSAWRHGRVA